ncbi:MAG: hypothetical protein ABIA37_03425 [Candidatus Woesearchaeota archaeon]
MDKLSFDRSIWTSIESCNRWIEKAQSEVRNNYEISSPTFQNNLSNLMDISEGLIANCKNFKTYPFVDLVEKIAEEILITSDLILSKIERGTMDRRVVGVQLELLKKKVKELKDTYAKIVSNEQRKAA